MSREFGLRQDVSRWATAQADRAGDCWRARCPCQQQQGDILEVTISRLYGLEASNLHLMSIGRARETDLRIVVFLK
jgi:hypothetical protein